MSSSSDVPLSDVPLSDVPLSDVEEINSSADEIPKRKLTVDNHASLNQLADSLKIDKFLDAQVIVGEAAEIDVNDDFNRELAFYKQGFEAVTRAKTILKKEGVAFTRPGDFFAEMLKSDEHMTRVKTSIDEKNKEKTVRRVSKKGSKGAKKGSSKGSKKGGIKKGGMKGIKKGSRK